MSLLLLFQGTVVTPVNGPKCRVSFQSGSSDENALSFPFRAGLGPWQLVEFTATLDVNKPNCYIWLDSTAGANTNIQIDNFEVIPATTPEKWVQSN